MSGTRVSNPRAGGDRAAEVAAVVARRWVRWYSGLVSTEAAERRRAEIESDLWEQRADAREAGAQSLTVAGSIVSRVVGGMPHDLLWVRTQRLTMRGLQADRKASPVNPLGNSLARWWWVAGAAVLAALYLGAGVENLTADYGPLPESAAQCFVYLAIIVAGIACSYKAPRTSGVLVATASLPTLALWWSPPLMIFGGAIATGALIQVARLSGRGFLPRAGAVLGGVLLGAALMAPMLGFAPGAVLSGTVSIVLTLAFGVAGVVLLIVTRSRAPERSEASPSATLTA
jgi:hypothetical protein